MTLIRITDLADKRLDPYRSLKQTNETARRGLFIAEGDKLVRRLLESRLTVESVLLSEPYVATFESLLPNDLPVLVIPDELVETLVGYNFHRGILGCGRRPASPPTFDDVLSTSNQERMVLVVCPDVQDPENLGAIVRLSAGFGVAAVVLGPECADPFSRRVQRVSMGAVYQLPIVACRDVVAALGELRAKHRVESWATVLDAHAVALGMLPLPSRLALVFGSEGHGLLADVAAACDHRVTIPMRAGVDSFNVAVAAGVFLHFCTQPTHH